MIIKITGISGNLQQMVNNNAKNRAQALAQGMSKLQAFADQVKQAIQANMQASDLHYPHDAISGLEVGMDGLVGPDTLQAHVSIPYVASSTKPLLMIESFYGDQNAVSSEGWDVVSIYENGWNTSANVPWKNMYGVGYHGASNAIHNAVAQIAGRAAAAGVTITY